MAIDLFINQNTPVTVPIGGVINSNDVIGNVGTDAATNVTLAKTVIVPAGMSLEVLFTQDFITTFPAGSIIVGPATASFIRPIMKIAGLSQSGVSVHSLNVAFRVLPSTHVDTAIIDIGTVIGAGDINPANNTEVTNISIVPPFS